MTGQDAADALAPRPERVRVTGARSGTGTGPIPMVEHEPLYVRDLRRAQLRLAFGCLIGFLVTAGALALVLLLVPALNIVVIMGAPLPWLLHAYGFYPIILVFALIYARAARHNEERFRTLAEGAP